jgi:hypothetical protein
MRFSRACSKAWEHTRAVSRHTASRAPSGTPPTGPLLLLSPHLDDAALSCAALLDRGEAVDLVNVFTGAPVPPVRTPWVELTGFADSAASMKARRLEDEAAFSGSGHRRQELGLLDDEFSAHPRPAADLEAIVDEVARWAADSGGGLVAAPVGAGWRGGRLRARLRSRPPIAVHPDHEFVRDATLVAQNRLKSISLLLYEELPYLLDGGAERVVRRLRVRGLRLEELVLPIDADSKARRISAYRSQLPHLGGENPGDPRSLPALERYWRVIR